MRHTSCFSNWLSEKHRVVLGREAGATMQPNQDKKPQSTGENQQPGRKNPQVIQSGVGGVLLAMGKTAIFVLIVVLIIKLVFGIKF